MNFFAEKARLFLDSLIAQLETAALLDYDDEENRLTLYLPDQRQYVIHLHHGLEQLWVSSPFSGGRHFIYRQEQWLDTRNGEDLKQVLIQELCSFGVCNI